MSPKPRLAALVALLLASPLYAANKSGTLPNLSPITVVALPSGIAAPQLTPTAFAALPGLSPLGTIPNAAAAVRTALPAAPALAATVLPTAAPSAKQAGPSMTAQLGAQSVDIAAAIKSDPSGMAGRDGLDKLFSGNKGGGRGFSGAPARKDASKDTVFIVNDEGVRINGRAAAYYKEVRRLVEKHKDRIDLAESLDVMDDTYADVWAKLATIEGVAKARGIEQHNTHLEETLLWVDGTMTDGRGRKIAVHTHRVYFHHSKSPASEIAEGIRRVDRYVDEALRNFERGGKAESVLGALDEIVLSFDSRGYSQIKDHLKAKERELAKKHGKRFRFVYVDELAPIPQAKDAMRAELNAFVRKYQGKGLQKIVEGVIYSRYVGILLELKTVEHYLGLGYEILQSGRDLFDANDQYITELDTVVRSPEGKMYVVEAKSARVKLPNEEALQDKVIYKLDTYKKNRARMEAVLGGPFDVVFSFDVGDNVALGDFLKSKEAELSKQYGFEVSFVFLDSTPEDQAALRKPKRRR